MTIRILAATLTRQPAVLPISDSERGVAATEAKVLRKVLGRADGAALAARA